MKLFRVKRVKCCLGDREELLMISQVLCWLKRAGMCIEGSKAFVKITRLLAIASVVKSW